MRNINHVTKWRAPPLSSQSHALEAAFVAKCWSLFFTPSMPQFPLCSSLLVLLVVKSTDSHVVERSPTAYLVATCRRQLCRHSVTHVYLFATHIMYI